MTYVDPEWETMKAWAAGFIDGEGCIHCGVSHGQPRIKLMVGQVDQRPLQKLSEMFGGAIVLHAKAKGNSRESWRWQVQGRTAQKILKDLMPYLVSKIDEAKLALEFDCGKDGHKPEDFVVQKRYEIMQQLKEMKRAV